MKCKNIALSFLSLMLVVGLFVGCTPVAAPAPTAAASAAPAPAPSAQAPAPSAAPAVTLEGPIKIGVILPLSSSAGITGNRIRMGMEMTVEGINKAGGIYGQQIELLFEDTQSSDPALALSAAEKLIHQDKVAIIVGCYGSSASLAVLPICEENKIPMVEPIATSPALTSGSEWIFRLSSTNAIDAERIGPYLPKLGFKNVAYLPVDNDWGISVTKAYIPILEAAGAKTISVEPITIGESNYLAQLTKIKNSGADSIIITQDIESASTLVRQIIEAGMKDFKILQTSGNSSFMCYELIGDVGDNVYFIEYYGQYGMTGAGDTPENKAFYDSVKALNKDTPVDYPVVEGVIAVNVIKEAIERAKSLDGTKLRDELRKTNYKSLRGDITFSDKGQAICDVLLTQLHAGGKVDVIDPTTIK